MSESREVQITIKSEAHIYPLRRIVGVAIPFDEVEAWVIAAIAASAPADATFFGEQQQFYEGRRCLGFRSSTFPATPEGVVSEVIVPVIDHAARQVTVPWPVDPSASSEP